MSKAETTSHSKDDEAVLSPDVPAQVRKALEAAANMMGVGVKKLWTIFVRQYIVRGISEAFFGVSILATAWYLEPHIGLWWLLAAAPAKILFYGAIQNLGNPEYYAIQDIIKKVKSFDDGKVKVIKENFTRI